MEEEPYLSFFTSTGGAQEDLVAPAEEVAPILPPPPRPPPVHAMPQEDARAAAQQMLRHIKARGGLAPHAELNPFVKRKLIFSIRRWCEAFPEELAGLCPPVPMLNKMGEHELFNLLREIKMAVGLSNSSALEKMVSTDMFYQIEDGLTQYTPIKATGLGNALSTNITFQKVLKECILDSTELFYTEPKYRALAMGAKVLWETHQQNAALEEHMKFMNEPLFGHNNERIDNEMQNIIGELCQLAEMTPHV